MGVLQTNTPLDHLGDAGFRTWGLEFSNALNTIGLVKTTDTGQINWATVTRPAGAGDAGYEIWRFNDSAQSTAPVFIKITYGGRAANAPRIAMQVGNGSDGAGNLTNPGTLFYVSGTLTSTAGTASTNYFSNFSYVEGCLTIAWKYTLAATAATFPFVSISRSCDVDGNLSNVGLVYIAHGAVGASSSPYTQSFNFATTTWTTQATSAANAETFFIPCPGTITSSFVGSNAQIYLGYGRFPRVQPFIGAVTLQSSEFGSDSTFTCKPVGTVSRTYLNLNSNANLFNTAASGYNLAMLWE